MKTIIFILLEKYNKRDHQRFGVDLLRSRGFNVRLWDVIEVFFEEIKTLALPPDYHVDDNLEAFTSKKQMTAQLQNLPPDSIVIPLIPCSVSTYLVYKILNKRKIDYVELQAGSLPSVPAKRGLKNIDLSILKKIMNKMIHCGFYHPTICLTSMKSSESKAKLLINAHNLDYDIYLEQQKDNSLSYQDRKHYAVFIDIGEADYCHQDLKICGVKKLISSEHYFPDMCDYFDYIEHEYNLEVIIAGHPRVRYQDRVFGDRLIIYQETPELIRNADLVLMHYSTSINFAILYHKPIIFIEFNKHYRECSNKRWPACMAASIKSKNIVTMGDASAYELPKEQLFCINDNAYQAYKDHYIKCPGSEEKNTWDVFADAIA